MYYAASDAFIHGKWPYQSFLLLHTPASTLFLAPFSFLGSVTYDGWGFMVARLVSTGIGAASAYLVYVLGTRINARTGLIAGFAYAVAWPAIMVENTTMLEPWATFFLLLAAVIITGPRTQTAWWMATAGALVGAAAATKVWYVAPLLVFGLWLLIPGRRRSRWANAGCFCAGVLASWVVLVAPFVAVAPHQFWTQVFATQLQRATNPITLSHRLAHLLYLAALNPSARSAGWWLILLCVAVLGLMVLASVRISRTSTGLLMMLWFWSAFAILLWVKLFYLHYTLFALAPECFLLAVAVDVLVGRLRERNQSIALTVLGAIAVAQIFVPSDVPLSGPAPSGSLTAGIGPSDCVSSDSLALLIATNRLSSDYSNNCELPGDVMGMQYYLRAVAPADATYRSYCITQSLLVRYLTDAPYTITDPAFALLPDGTNAALSKYEALQRTDGPYQRFNNPRQVTPDCMITAKCRCCQDNSTVR